MPNSSMFVLPTTTAPSSCSSFTTVASYGLLKSLRIPEEAVVFSFFVQMLSFIAIGLSATLSGWRRRVRDLEASLLWRMDASTRELNALKCLYFDWFAKYVFACLERDMEGGAHRRRVVASGMSELHERDKKKSRRHVIGLTAQVPLSALPTITDTN